jgi:hypothetical protein
MVHASGSSIPGSAQLDRCDVCRPGRGYRKASERVERRPALQLAGVRLPACGIGGPLLGGYTVLELGGAWRGWKDPRVKAVLALSPYAAPFIWRKTLSGIDAPVMYQGGTRDYGITPFVNKGDGAYDQTPAPKYFVDFDGAGHFAWTNLRGTYHTAIIDYSLAFLDRYLKGKPFPHAVAEPHKNVALVKIKE